MDITIRNLNEEVYRELKARAAIKGIKIGEALNLAIRHWLGEKESGKRNLVPKPSDWGKGTEMLSEEINKYLYDEK